MTKCDFCEKSVMCDSGKLVCSLLGHDKEEREKKCSDAISTMSNIIEPKPFPSILKLNLYQ